MRRTSAGTSANRNRASTTGGFMTPTWRSTGRRASSGCPSSSSGPPTACRTGITNSPDRRATSAWNTGRPATWNPYGTLSCGNMWRVLSGPFASIIATKTLSSPFCWASRAITAKRFILLPAMTGHPISTVNTTPTPGYGRATPLPGRISDVFFPKSMRVSPR
ncbi:MAG: hypothetical protein BWX80_04187 [Candidatus Hydrogenedentes bacterium ADurb.Bin101]|nr:MAG: hypothetical protein BWX80_04187 [Candidatus Hydrogenedentes bacterium ADurb.Bin101]